jgi:hypothetical protein
LKYLLFAVLALLTLKSFAADLALKHQQLCGSEVAKAQMGKTGSCRIVMTPTKTDTSKGSCIGKYSNVMPCLVTYITSLESSSMSLTCGFEGQKPVLEVKDIESVGRAYKVSAVVTREDKSQTIINDNGAHLIIESGAFGLTVSAYEQSRSGTITLNFKKGSAELSNVECF